MIHLSLTAQEAVELLTLLVESGEKRLSTRLSSEVVSTLESLDALDRDKKASLSAAWLRRQSIKLAEKENDNVG